MLDMMGVEFFIEIKDSFFDIIWILLIGYVEE